MNAKRRAASLLLGVILAACGSTPTTPKPAGSSPAAASLNPFTTPSPTLAPPATVVATTLITQATRTPAPTPSPMPKPSAASVPTPSPAPTLGPVTAASLPVQSSDARTDILLDPDGVPYAIVVARNPPATVIVALDDDGLARRGWPIAIPDAYVGGAAFSYDGTLYILLGSEEGMALTALRRDGRVAAGWPVRLGSRDSCDFVLPVEILTESTPDASVDLTVRLVCGIEGDVTRVYAFDRRGRALQGWPVELAGSHPHLYQASPIVLGTSLVGVQGGHGWVRRYTIDADGTVHFGRKVTAPVYDSPCYDDRHWAPMSFLGPDGTAYLWSYRLASPAGPDACRFISSTYTAFDDRGVRAGWPVTIAGESSEPVLGPDGRIYVTQGSQEQRPARIYAFDARGRRVPGWPATIDVAPAIGQGGEGWWPPAPVFVGDDGTVYLVTEVRSEAGGTTIYALIPDGSVRPGWPYRGTSDLGDTATPCATGGGHPVVPPVIDGEGRIHLVHGASPFAPSGYGSQATLVDDGRTLPGWPVTLRRSGSRFVQLTVDAAGVTYALALEYEGPLRCGPSPKSSETLLAIGLNGTVLYRTTLLEP